MRSSEHFAASEPVYWLPNAMPAHSGDESFVTVACFGTLWETFLACSVGADHVVALLALAEAKHSPDTLFSKRLSATD